MRLLIILGIFSIIFAIGATPSKGEIEAVQAEAGKITLNF